MAWWVRGVIEESGVDASVFSAHSTRGAASSAAAMPGLSVQQIMARAGWAAQDTFIEHYYKPTAAAEVAETFGQAVLSVDGATNMKGHAD